MKKSALRFFLLCAVALTQFGCTSLLYLDKTQPAAVSVANSQWKVAVLNRYNPELLPFEKDKKVAVFADGVRGAYAGVLGAIEQDSTYLLVYTDTASFKAATTQEQLTPAQVKEIYSQAPHHLLLSLDDFDTFFEQTTVREEADNGEVSKTAYYTLVAKSSWTLYDSTGAVLDKATLTQEVPYQSRAVVSGLLAIGPALSKAGPVVNELAWETGLFYWERLSPHPVTVARAYYSAQDFFPAAIRMAAGEWQQAVTLLQPLTKSPKRKEAARAAYNLAVVYEALGNLKEARYWANEALQKRDKRAPSLLAELEKFESL
ncbi:hypothetical protein CLV24_10282 [Pontibacter ummariensis]|uniref:Tetratricopeptide repeat-containing protein n=1 Tax=Pontibacter ummariensis TaxID=1610492 RepID=A0A239C4K2_9BACT|nr:DUF6340 family protein [Pontibacter ummariensis]PRY15461.1 hypothetical protein CLV24_10282 [Pontibacter ummariensis]SNS14849.1 Tetratricopeptide repeat-containing protein [Pontibacter ummariensis]